jgi:hypothetical protein
MDIDSCNGTDEIQKSHHLTRILFEMARLSTRDAFHWLVFFLCRVSFTKNEKGPVPELSITEMAVFLTSTADRSLFVS